MPPHRDAHIRDDTETREGEWTALCGAVRPATSFSKRHARLVLTGTIAGNQVLALCALCEALLRAELESTP
jgi:hypothetical protein